MKANFTSKLNTIAKAFVFTAALMFLGHQGHAQAPLRGGSTYYVNGIGVDLVAPKDTFKDLSGTYSGTPYVTPYTTTTGIMNALTLNGTDSTTFGTVNIILAPGYVGYVEPNLINVGDPNNGGYPYQGSNRPIVLSPAAGYNDTITSSTVINGTSFNSLWKFNGIQFFTIDGQSTTGQRNLTFKMTASSNSTNAQIINIVSPSAVGSGTQYITIKNCNFIGNSNSTAINTWSAIYMGTVYFGVVMPWNNFKTSQNITIQNNDIRAVQNGIYMRGKGDVAGSQDRFLNINNNIIGGSIAPGGTANTDFVGGSSTSSGSSGIYLSAQANATIQNNIIRNSVNNTVGFTAILLDNASGTAALDSNLYINANTIYNITTNVVGYASNGIRVAMGTHTQPLAIVISNNIMGNISGPGYLALNSTNISSAIMIQDASANAGVSILHNSMNMYGSVLSGTYETINTVVSFESGEQGTSYIYLPYSCTIVAMSGSVVKALSGTDNGTVALYDSVTRTLVDTMTIPLSSTLFTLIEDNAINYNFATFGGISAPFSKIYLAPTKTTAGGKIAISILVRRA